jgi:hypothetical protein
MNSEFDMPMDVRWPATNQTATSPACLYVLPTLKKDVSIDLYWLLMPQN